MLPDPDDARLAKMLGFDPSSGAAVVERIVERVVVQAAPPPVADLQLSHLAEARLFGNLKAIMMERGMAAAVLAANRALQDVAECARACGRSTDGFIG